MAGYNAEWQKELERLKKQRQNQQLARAPMLNTDDARANTDVEMSQAEMRNLEKSQPEVEVTMSNDPTATEAKNTTNTGAQYAAAAGFASDVVQSNNKNANMGSVAGLTVSGAATGAMVGGGIGAGVGTAAGFTVGMIQASAAQKQRERELENQKLRMIADIEQNRAAQLNSAISGMASRIGSSLQTHVLRL